MHNGQPPSKNSVNSFSAFSNKISNSLLLSYIRVPYTFCAKCEWLIYIVKRDLRSKAICVHLKETFDFVNVKEIFLIISGAYKDHFAKGYRDAVICGLYVIFKSAFNKIDQCEDLYTYTIVETFHALYHQNALSVCRWEG